jgi:hypothetical protein
MDRTAYTEPHCLYNGALYLFLRMRGAISEFLNTPSLHGYGKLYLYVFFEYFFLSRLQFQLTKQALM